MENKIFTIFDTNIEAGRLSKDDYNRFKIGDELPGDTSERLGLEQLVTYKRMLASPLTKETFLVTATDNTNVSPAVCDGLFDALGKCLTVGDSKNYRIEYKNGNITFTQYLKDGSEKNYLIRCLSSKGIIAYKDPTQRDRISDKEIDFKDYLFKKIRLSNFIRPE